MGELTCAGVGTEGDRGGSDDSRDGERHGDGASTEGTESEDSLHRKKDEEDAEAAVDSRGKQGTAVEGREPWRVGTLAGEASAWGVCWKVAGDGWGAFVGEVHRGMTQKVEGHGKRGVGIVPGKNRRKEREDACRKEKTG